MGRPVYLIKIFTALLIAIVPFGAFGKSSGGDRTKPANKPINKLDSAVSDLVAATDNYKASLEALLPLHERALKDATEALEKRKELYTQGIISKLDLDRSEQAIKEAQAALDQTRKQIVESDNMLAEARAEEDEPAHRPGSTAPSARSRGYSARLAILRSSGSRGWSINQASMVQNFFISKAGRALPVSAFGQTETHNRMGFDHRNSMDVAVHPDSAEGKALIAYLRGNGIPFIAFRSAVKGAATGAHIHIGYPSHRISKT